MSTNAPFGEAFDAIDLAATRADRHAIERAMAHVAPAEAPGFYLLDDAGGRFVVDRALGVVSLRDESILEAERNSVHAARLRVVEPSGACYEMEMKLRLTGRVPKMVGAEDIDFLAGAPAIDAPPASAAPRAISWSAYAAFAPEGAPQAINDEARFGRAVAQAVPPAAAGPYRLHLFTPLPPHAEKSAIWSL
ncbi:MAG TPA: hypothetical protein PLK37_10430 [Terricaulis sp.]|nr:hypothetical protein [Terricaulis sp.]